MDGSSANERGEPRFVSRARDALGKTARRQDDAATQERQGRTMHNDELIARGRGHFVIFQAVGIDARALELDVDDVQELVTRLQQDPDAVRADLIGRGAPAPVDDARHEPASVDQLWALARATRAHITEPLSRAAVEYLLADPTSPGLTPIVRAYSDDRVKHHGDPASSAQLRAIYARTQRRAVFEGRIHPSIGEAAFLIDRAKVDPAWVVDAVAALPPSTPGETVRIERDGDAARLPLRAEDAARFPAAAEFDVVVSDNGIFFRRVGATVDGPASVAFTNARAKLLAAMLEDDRDWTVRKLEHRTGVSVYLIKKSMKVLSDAGWVTRKLDTSNYPPFLRFCLTDTGRLHAPAYVAQGGPAARN